jgi:hypothetical protein
MVAVTTVAVVTAAVVARAVVRALEWQGQWSFEGGGVARAVVVARAEAV